MGRLTGKGTSKNASEKPHQEIEMRRRIKIKTSPIFRTPASSAPLLMVDEALADEPLLHLPSAYYTRLLPRQSSFCAFALTLTASLLWKWHLGRTS